MALRARISYLYAAGLLTVYALFLPLGGYARMMEGKYHAFLLLSLGYLLTMTALGAWRTVRLRGPMCLAALAYLTLTALSAALSPYGTAALLGGTRRDGLLTVALYVACFLLLARHLRADRRLLCAAAGSAVLCDVLVLLQLTGRNPLWLYPAGLNYFDGDAAYTGFYAGTAGNIDFTAFLLALCAAAMAAALVRGQSKWPALPLALTLWTLAELRVAATLLGLAAAAVLCLPLLFPQRRRAMWALAALLTAAALLLVWTYGGENQTLTELCALLRGEGDAAFGSGRLAIWRALLPLAAERPLLGGGCGTLYLRDIPPFYWYRGGETIHVAITSAHNEYLGILVDQGIPALLVFLALLAFALRRAYRGAESGRCAVAGTALVCYAVMAFFSVATCITSVYLWLLLAVLAREG